MDFSFFPAAAMFKKLFMLCLMPFCVVSGALAGSAEEGKAQLLLIDVRTPAEFDQGHLKDAVNIEYQQIVQALSIYGLDKAQPIGLYCRSGNRSGVATRALQQAGYTNVVNLGGFEALRRQGYPVAD